jgi:Tol biopolymer transport system component
MKGFSHSGVLGMTMRGALLYSTGSRVLQVQTAKLNGPDGALSAPQPINAPSQYMTVSPTWSPNGRFLCYQLMEPDRPDQLTPPDSIVMVRDLSNGQEREIGRFPPIGRRISWTADSKSLVLPTTTTAGRNVLRVDVGSGKSEALIPAALTDSRSNYAYPRCRPMVDIFTTCKRR